MTDILISTMSVFGHCCKNLGANYKRIFLSRSISKTCYCLLCAERNVHEILP